MSTASQTFTHLLVGVAGAAISIWGAQQLCDDQASARAYAACTKVKGKTTKSCAAEHKPGGDKIHMYTMYGGIAFIIASFAILGFMDSGYGGGGGGRQW